MGFLEIFVSSSDKHLPVLNLRVMDLPGFKFDLAFQVDISGKQNSLIDVIVESVDGDAQFRVVSNDHIG